MFFGGFPSKLVDIFCCYHFSLSVNAESNLGPFQRYSQDCFRRLKPSNAIPQQLRLNKHSLHDKLRNFNSTMSKITHHLFERRLHDWNSWEKGTLSQHILCANSVHLVTAVYSP